MDRLRGYCENGGSECCRFAVTANNGGEVFFGGGGGGVHSVGREREREREKEREGEREQWCTSLGLAAVDFLVLLLGHGLAEWFACWSLLKKGWKEISIAFAHVSPAHCQTLLSSSQDPSSSTPSQLSL